MSDKLKIHVALFLFLFVGRINGQGDTYIIAEAPNIFSSLEEKLEAEELDSVLEFSNNIIGKYDDPKIKGIAYFYQGEAKSLLQHSNAASTAYRSAIVFLEKAKYAKGLSLAYVKAADECFFRQDFQKADSLYADALQLLEDNELYHPTVDAYQKRANIAIAKQQTANGISFLKKALGHSLTKKEKYQAADIVNQVSTNYHAVGELDSAIFYFKKLMGLKKENGDEEGVISDYSALGNLYRERGEYKKAQQLLMSALEIAETEKDTFSLITLFTEMGDIHAAQNIIETAENYYLKALEFARLKKRAFAEAACYKKLGDIFLLQNNKVLAVENYEAALALYEKLNNKTNTADVLIHLSEVYEKRSEYAKAKLLLLEALELRKNSRDLMSTLSIKQSLAIIEINEGNYTKGIKYAEECLSEFKAMDDKEGLRDIYFILANASGQAGDFRKAYRFHQAYTTVKDSLNSIERTKAVKELDALYSTEKKDKEIAQQNEKIQAQQVQLLQKNNQLLMLVGGVALLILLAVFLFYVFLKNKQLNQQRIEVLEKEKEAQQLKAMIQGEEKERKRFAQELHDGLGATLATVKMQINGIKRTIPEAEDLATYQKAENLIDDACRSVREISHNLMPYVLEQQGLFFAIEDMCHNLAVHHKAKFNFISFGKESKLGKVLKISLFRMVQELLKNIVQHAEAKEVIVQLTIEEKEVMLIVEDDGKGFDVQTEKKGIGIDNLQSRINYMKGTLDIDSKIGEGSTFTIQLPLGEKR